MTFKVWDETENNKGKLRSVFYLNQFNFKSLNKNIFQLIVSLVWIQVAADGKKFSYWRGMQNDLPENIKKLTESLHPAFLTNLPNFKLQEVNPLEPMLDISLPILELLNNNEDQSSWHDD